jgi:hypothetical protein
MQSATLVFRMSCTLSYSICRVRALRRAELRINSWSAADGAAPNGNSSLRAQTRELRIGTSLKKARVELVDYCWPSPDVHQGRPLSFDERKERGLSFLDHNSARLRMDISGVLRYPPQARFPQAGIAVFFSSAGLSLSTGVYQAPTR